MPGRGNSTCKGLFKKWSDELWAQSADHLRERAGDEVREVAENCHRPWNTLWIILNTWVFILKYGEPLEGTRQRNNGFWLFILRESQWLLDGEQASGKWARTEAKSWVGKLLAVILVRVDGNLVVRKLRSRGLDRKSANSDSGGLETRGESQPLKHLPPWSLKDGEEATLQTLPLPLRTVQNYVTLSYYLPSLKQILVWLSFFFNNPSRTFHMPVRIILFKVILGGFTISSYVSITKNMLDMHTILKSPSGLIYEPQKKSASLLYKWYFFKT